MPNTLLLCLSGPMQSWGVQGRMSLRDTGTEPSKSGVLGLVCAALGVHRADDAALARLAALRMGVRVDLEGVMKQDYHTAQNVLKANGGIKPCEVTTRFYLADACFLVGLAGGDLALLMKIQDALTSPAWPLSLGRKAFVPGRPVRLDDGLLPDVALEDALSDYPALSERAAARVRVVLEDPAGSVVRNDQPVSFTARRFAPRRMSVSYVTLERNGKNVPVENIP